jgi:hypothetical protein
MNAPSHSNSNTRIWSRLGRRLRETRTAKRGGAAFMEAFAARTSWSPRTPQSLFDDADAIAVVGRHPAGRPVAVIESAKCETVPRFWRPARVIGGSDSRSRGADPVQRVFRLRAPVRHELGGRFVDLQAFATSFGSGSPPNYFSKRANKRSRLAKSQSGRYQPSWPPQRIQALSEPAV